jgi:outer membrane protein assembly factor BamB
MADIMWAADVVGVAFYFGQVAEHLMKRFIQAALIGSLLGSLAASSAAAAKFEWPQWQGPTRNCLTTETGLLKSWPEGGPKQLWVNDKCGAGYSGPAVVGGRIYILGDRDDTCYLLALDEKTGNEIWATSLGPGLTNDWGDGPRDTPTVDGDFIYAMSGKGKVGCFRLKDGSEVWSTSMTELGGKEPTWGYCESVLVDGDKVLCTPGGDQGAIAALDKKNGNILWRSTELNDGAQYASISRVVFHGQPQYVQLFTSRVVGISPADGKLLWQADWPGGKVAVIPTPIIGDSQVFVTSGYGAGDMLVAISDQNEATKVYESKEMKNHHGGVIRVGDYIYGHSDPAGWMCLDWATGEKKWRERDKLAKGAIAYADGMFYLLGEDEGTVVLIDASSEGWQEHGRFTLAPLSEIRKPKSHIWTHPVIVGGKLFLRDQDHIYCYDVKNAP